MHHKLNVRVYNQILLWISLDSVNEMAIRILLLLINHNEIDHD